jgi:hypothetical protein
LGSGDAALWLPSRRSFPLVKIGFTQPQREVGGLHGLIDHPQDRLVQLLQVYFIRKGLAERLQHIFQVVLVAIKAAVDKILNPAAEWVK